MKRGIDRGIKEIEKITGELISCFFHKAEKKFIFGWHQKEKYPKLRIPYKRIDEFIDWYLTHNKELKVNSILKYKSGLKKKILEDEFNDLSATETPTPTHPHSSLLPNRLSTTPILLA
jgi:hypothetical protein